MAKKDISIPDHLQEAQSIIARVISRLVRARAQKSSKYKDKEINIALKILQGKK